MSVLADSTLTNASVMLTVQFSSQYVIPSTCLYQLVLPDEMTLIRDSTTLLQISNISYYNQSMALLFSENLKFSFEKRSVMLKRSTRNPTSQTESSGTLVIVRNGNVEVPANTIVMYTAGLFQRMESSGKIGEFRVLLQKASVFDSANVDGHVLSYPTPTIMAVFPLNTRKPGGASITVIGRHYGPIKENPYLIGDPEQRQIELGGMICKPIFWTSDSTLVCLSPPGGKLITKSLSYLF